LSTSKCTAESLAGSEAAALSSSSSTVVFDLKSRVMKSKHHQLSLKACVGKGDWNQILMILVEIPENLTGTTKFLTSLEPPAYEDGSSPGPTRWACKLAAQLA
jgi:hypothetical protein